MTRDELGFSILNIAFWTSVGILLKMPLLSALLSATLGNCIGYLLANGGLDEDK